MVVAGELCLGTTALPGAAAALCCGQALLQWVGAEILWSHRNAVWHPSAFPEEMIPAHIELLSSKLTRILTAQSFLGQSSEVFRECWVWRPGHHGNVLLFTFKYSSQAGREQASIPASKTEASQVCHINMHP